MTALTACLTIFTNAHLATASTVWVVGPERELKVPSQAAKVAQHGDTVLIEAGQYYNDYAVWTQDNLTIRGFGGIAKLGSNRLIPNDKGIWIIDGDNTVIENLEFSGARVRSTNGAGIRHQGGDLTIRNSFFHHNEFSVLTGNELDADIKIINSRFWFQRRATRFSHGIYIGSVKSFTLRGSHIKGTDQGHQVKSRAYKNHIAYNRIEDIEIGGSSRLIDLPNCGDTVVLGNELHQGAGTHNIEIIGYGAEQCPGRTTEQKVLYVMHNTLVNEAIGGTLVRNHTEDAAVHVGNNLLFGRAWVLRGAGNESNNLNHRLRDRTPESWRLPAGSPAINAAATLAFENVELTPMEEFTLPVGTQARIISGQIDVGAKEFHPAP